MITVRGRHYNLAATVENIKQVARELGIRSFKVYQEGNPVSERDLDVNKDAELVTYDVLAATVIEEDGYRIIIADGKVEIRKESKQEEERNPYRYEYAHEEEIDGAIEEEDEEDAGSSSIVWEA